MTANTSPTPETWATGDDGDDDDLDHVFCCDKDIALCGRDVAALVEATSSDEINIADVCIVCRELAKKPCERCGE